MLLIATCMLSCKTQNKEATEENTTLDTIKTETKKKKQRPISYKNGKFFDIEGRQMLYGGKDSIQHFDITEMNIMQLISL